MTAGAPRSAYADDDFIMIRGEAVRALGDYHAAGVFQRIAWRCERSGSWRATIGQIADEVWLSEKQVRKALNTLRAHGWVAGEQMHRLDRTLTWSVVWAETPKRPTGHMGGPTGHLESPHGALLPSIEDKRQNYKTISDADAPGRVSSGHALVDRAVADAGEDWAAEECAARMLERGEAPEYVANTIVARTRRYDQGGVR